MGLSMSKVNAGIACFSNATYIPPFNLGKAREIERKQYLIFQYLNIFVPLVSSKEDARGVPLRDLLLFFSFNLTWPGRVKVGWHETSQSN